jgi:para-aminobenzoate synthetase/4-amino-4-deoxychorismate lyase
MQIIRELEPCPRGVYTGAIGFISPKGVAVFSVPIRTIVLNRGRGEMGVGSGIVFDSTAADEYQECQLKAKFLTSVDGANAFSLIESMLWNGGCTLLPLHLVRLQTSASELGFVFDKAAIMARLEANAKRLQLGIRYKVRMTLDREGAVTVENTALTEGASNGQVVFSAVSTSSDDPFFRHKTTRRQLYDAMYKLARERGYDDVLFLNERGEVTEGAISNVFIEKGGKLYTPPVACGALPGVYRRRLLDTNSAATEKTLCPEDLHSADAIYICNAVRGLRRVELDDNASLHHDRCSH